jgi:Ras-related protein Rab-1A
MGTIQCYNIGSCFQTSSDFILDNSTIPQLTTSSNSIPIPKPKTIRPIQQRRFLPTFLSPTPLSSSNKQSFRTFSSNKSCKARAVPTTSKSSLSSTYIDSTTVTNTGDTIRKALASVQVTKERLTYLDAVNISILGPNEVGKSCFCIKLADNKFLDVYIPSISLEVKTRLCKVKDQTKNMNIFAVPNDDDIKEKYKTILQGSQIIFILYDVTNNKSFDKARNLYEKEILFKNVKTELEKCNNDYPFVCFVGNKIDLKHEQSLINKAEIYCHENSILHCLVSTKTAKGIRQLMHSMLDKLNC